MKMRSKVVVGVLAAVILGGGVYSWASNETEPVNLNLNEPTVALAKTELANYISATGAVESSSSTNIYPESSVQTYPIMEVLVEVGDAVKKGDVLARLDMSRLRDEIESAELTLLNTQATSAETKRNNANAVETAETALTTSQISLERQITATTNAEKDLRDAEADMEEPSDSYTYDKVIDDARVNLERMEKDLATAREDLDEADDEEFDDVQLKNAVRDAEITLARAESDLATAQNDLDEELADEETFDAYPYQNAIADTKTAYDRAKEARDSAEEGIEKAEMYLDEVINRDSTELAITEAELKVTEAEAAYEKAKQAVDDTKLAYDRAIKERSKAEEDFKKNDQDVKSDKVKALEKSVETATNILNDAQRAYDDAVQRLADAEEDFNEAIEDAVELAQDAVTRAENNLFDAQRAYEKALSDKEHAIEDYIEANEDALERAQRTYTDSREMLETVKTDQSLAQIRLDQAIDAPDNSETSVEIQQINLKKLYDNLADGEIVATADGVVTESNAKVGALPTGILFVIEDTGDLLVTANIKEYSLSQVFVGQKAIITTDATGDTEYDATVDYISPKAVTPAGSTSVEFEIQASFDAGDDTVRIGMNAFVDVVVDSREDVYAVPLSAVVTDERGSFVYSPDGAERKEIPVTLGIRNTSHREISGEGLFDGLEILLQPVALPVSGFAGMM